MFGRWFLGDHIIVATNRTKIGKLYGKEVFALTGHQIIPVSKSKIHLSDSQIRDDTIYMSLLDSLLSSGCFYFSYAIDITHSLQRISKLDVNDHRPLWKRVMFMNLNDL
jgi:hypothetical protein